jgi:hypothetical protein
MRVRVSASSLASHAHLVFKPPGEAVQSLLALVKRAGAHPCAPPSASQRSTARRRSWDVIGEGTGELL